MSFDLETLYNLLPSVYRIRDLEQVTNGFATPLSSLNGNTQQSLRALLQVIATQVGILEENLAQLYDDQFIETCAPWVIPYIGDLVAYNTPHDTSSQSLRSEVAHTISYRKRKGTAALIEQLARDVTGWDVHVVEFFQTIAATQHINRPCADNTPVDLRKGIPLDRLNTPFDSLAHRVDMRNIAAERGSYNIPNIGIFIWRLEAYSLTRTTAAKHDDRRYFFSPLGNNTQLFTHPTVETDITQLAGPRNVAAPISRKELNNFLSDYYGPGKSILLTVSIDGKDIDILPNAKQPSERLEKLIVESDILKSCLDALHKALEAKAELDEEIKIKSHNLQNGLNELFKLLHLIENRDTTKLEKLIGTSRDLKRYLDELEAMTDVKMRERRLEDIIKAYDALRKDLATGNIDPQQLDDLFLITDLSDITGSRDWQNMHEKKIAIDPILGRFAFPKDIPYLLGRMGLSTTATAFSNVRSTFYYGCSAEMGGGEYHRAASFTTGLDEYKLVCAYPVAIQQALDELSVPLNPGIKPPDGVVEINGSGRIKGMLSITAAANQRIELRAADFCRPLLKLEMPEPEDKTKPPELPEMSISGAAGSQVTLNGLVISHGILKVSGNLERLTLRHCTLVPGLSLSEKNEPQHPSKPSLIVESANTVVEIDHCIVGALHIIESATVNITNSIVDATGKHDLAYAGTNGAESHGGALHVENSTIIGSVRTVSMGLASNTIFLGQVDVARRQEGCVRFSYVPDGSLTPRRYNCQPLKEGQAKQVEPQFTSSRYGTQGYCQLRQRTPIGAQQGANGSRKAPQESPYDALVRQQAENEARIRQGADDQAEMGAFHDLFQSQRETNLRLRLAEYLRFTLTSEIIYIT